MESNVGKRLETTHTTKKWVGCLSGAKECTACRSRKMLKNDYSLTKISVDTTENEPNIEI